MRTTRLLTILVGLGLVSLFGALAYSSNCNLSLLGPSDRQYVPTRVLMQGTGTPDSALLVQVEKLDREGRVLGAQNFTRRVNQEGNFRFHITINPTDLPLHEQSFRVTYTNPDPLTGNCAPIVVTLFPKTR